MRPRYNDLEVIPALGRGLYTWRFMYVARNPIGLWCYDVYPMDERLLVSVPDRHLWASLLMGSAMKQWRPK